MQPGSEQLLDMYRKMRTIRAFEERIHREVADATVPGFVHLYAGEEASAVGVCAHLGSRDYIGSTHRGHGHCIAKGCSVKDMMMEIYARKDGLCGGKGGSMHIADFEKGMMGANAIVGGSAPSCVGAALTARTLKTGGIAVAFSGDGSANQGAALESLNLASVWKVPVVFVIEDNDYAESTASSWANAGDMLDRARGFAIPARRVEAGHDVFEVYAAAGEAVEHARSGKGPFMLHVKVPRFYAHYEGDAGTYRPADEVDNLRSTRDCLQTFRRRAAAGGLLDAARLDAIDGEVDLLVDAAVAEAKAAPPPGADDLLTNVYTSY